MVDRDAAAAAFLAEVAYYRTHSLTAPDRTRLRLLRRSCAAILGEELQRACRHDLLLDDLERLLLGSLHFHLLPAAAECLASLTARGVKLAVVSNWDCSLVEVLEGLSIRRYFVHVAASAVVGAEKPDPRIWQEALAVLGTRPEETWHVGDEPEADLAGALRCGLQPILVGEAAAPAGVPRLASLAELPSLLDGLVDGEVSDA